MSHPPLSDTDHRLRIRRTTGRATLLAGLLLALSAGPAMAWHIEMHAELARIAHSALPSHIRGPLAPYLPELMQGARDPDLDLQDLPNHFLNIHVEPGTSRLAQTRIEHLSREIGLQLSDPAADLSQIAFQLGRLSHYLGDIDQPLHTDEREGEALMHLDYEDDAWARMPDLPLFDRGIRYRFDPAGEALHSALEANRFYSAVLSPYLDGRGIDDVLGVTRLNVQRAAEDIRDTWTTLWEMARADGPRIALSASRRHYTLGESVRLTLSMLIDKGTRDQRADLCLAVVGDSGDIAFLDPKSRFVTDPVCYRREMALTSQSMEVYDGLLLPQAQPGEYRVYAVLVRPGEDPLEPSSWLSNLTRLDITVEALPELHFQDLADEVYLYRTRSDDGQVSALPLRRWDILFVGRPEAATDQEAEEDLVHRLIPGAFSHILVYLGRDREGTPYALEHTQSLTHEIVNLRLVRLPEFHPYSLAGEHLPLPLVGKDLWNYRVRGARRLVAAERQRVKRNEAALLQQLERQWRDRFAYQFQFDLSDLEQGRILLVDDGLTGGAGCTDYWLAVLEQTAGVCIHGSRMNAGELTTFYRNDPVATNSIIPVSELNPFPFPLKVSSIFGEMGFNLVDPPPHRFRCDGSRETGVAVPDLLYESPQLEAIAPDPAVDDWILDP